ncbi:pentapeptide repeat-containing protein [Rhizobium laguerreae]|uniref:pentapeptide repeat-containing protein n=1 Tax=Rhizobium laguerreae TaxID=1076926 RepID=UPI001C903819|nr:pentapeptide repeat-containing protein [Rhizobium laguerreae]MBY3143290.1 pentapeptide repeat-containing protein [Rhizobium laguerreae]MBY3475263.1 pentapeptide repeat-containing protein [Rhizobium laguerreae]MBY3574310.1 pentapeptide repeat-containing protein [Rhizobium laguerreae]
MMFDRLRALCAARTDNLAELAEIAAPGDPAFFDGAQFSGADLRATNLTGFRLHGAALGGAEVDETTILPDTTSLLDLKRSDKDTPFAVHVVDGISSAIQKEVIASLDHLERKAGRHGGSNIRGPISRRSSNIPLKNDNERNFRLSAIRRMRRLASDIVASRESDLTIGGVLKNVERLVAMIEICESVLKKYEPRIYQRISQSMKGEMEKLGVLVASHDVQVFVTRQQWKAILSLLPATVSSLEYIGEFASKSGSGDILANLLFRIFFLLEDVKDLYLALPADQQKIDPIGFQIQIETADEAREPHGLREPHVM